MQKHALLEEQLQQDEALALKNNRTGMLIFQVSWIMAFVCMVVVNWQLRFSPNWQPEGTTTANPLVGLFATVTLGMSTLLVWRALKAIRQDDTRAFFIQWVGTIGLGGLFIVVMAVEWLTMPAGTQYALVFRLMTGFHMVHALVIGLYMLGVYHYARQGQYGVHNHWAVEAGAKLWYFVLVAWILFYIVIYWV
jgi:heme/copper-type cytochrome/quinol oxidase subunit 3